MGKVGARCSVPLLLNVLVSRYKTQLQQVPVYLSPRQQKNKCLTRRPRMPDWQRNYYEHTIRNDQDVNEITEHIKTIKLNGIRFWKPKDLIRLRNINSKTTRSRLVQLGLG
jgi:hypothetical protein